MKQEKSFRVNIYTPYGIYVSRDADYLSVFTPKGEIGVLPGHASLISLLEISKLVIRLSSQEDVYAIGGGFINIKEESVVDLLVNSIEKQDEIDIDRAMEAKKRAEEHLEDGESDIARAKIALAKALNRINIYNGK